MHPELIQYIKEQRAAGIPDAVIEKATSASGWPIDEVRAIFTSLGTPKVTEHPVSVQADLKKSVSAQEDRPNQRTSLRIAIFFVKIVIFIILLCIALAAGYLLGQSDRGNPFTATIIRSSSASPSAATTH